MTIKTRVLKDLGTYKEEHCKKLTPFKIGKQRYLSYCYKFEVFYRTVVNQECPLFKSRVI